MPPKRIHAPARAALRAFLDGRVRRLDSRNKCRSARSGVRRALEPGSRAASGSFDSALTAFGPEMRDPAFVHPQQEETAGAPAVTIGADPTAASIQSVGMRR